MNKSIFKRFDTRQYMMVIALVCIWAVFAVLSSGTFFEPRNMSNLFRQSVFTGILALGMINVIVLGQIDLSVGSLAGLCGGILAMLNLWQKLPSGVAIVITLAVGLAVGFWNGWWVAYRKVPSFIVTMAGLLIFRGILVGLSNGITVGPLDPFFNIIGKNYLPDQAGIFLGAAIIIVFIIYQSVSFSRKKALNLQRSNPWLICILFGVLVAVFVWAMNAYQGIPIPVIILMVLAVIFYYISTKTIFGRRIYAIGGNVTASRLAGINTKSITLRVFAINGFMAALAGIFLTSRLNSAASNAGTSAELDAIAACVIGGASLMGGIGTIPGAVIGAIVMASIDNGMSLLNAPSFYQQIVKGLVLLIAVWFDISQKKESKV
jgi:ABC-type xylose transport system, permease component